MWVDFNCANKLVYGIQMLDNCRNYGFMLPEEIFSGKNRMLDNCSLAKTLPYNIAGQLRTSWYCFGRCSSIQWQDSSQYYGSGVSSIWSLQNLSHSYARYHPMNKIISYDCIWWFKELCGLQTWNENRKHMLRQWCGYRWMVSTQSPLSTVTNTRCIVDIYCVQSLCWSNK